MIDISDHIRRTLELALDALEKVDYERFNESAIAEARAWLDDQQCTEQPQPVEDEKD